MAHFDRAQFALEFPPALQAICGEFAALDRGEHCAPRLVVVRAVGEFALRRKLFDVGERRVERARSDIPELQLADAGRVEHEPAAGQHEKLADSRRVPAFVVVLPGLARRHDVLAEPAIDERRLADARRAEQHGGLPGLDTRAERVAPLTVTAETTWTATPSATASTSATSSHGSSMRSAFVSTISGVAPLSQIVTR